MEKLGTILNRTYPLRPEEPTGATPPDPDPGAEPGTFFALDVVCHSCGDVGQVRILFDPDKGEQPRYVPCEACPRPTIQVFGERAGIPTIYRGKVFADFDGIHNMRAKQIMSAYVSHWGGTGPHAPPPFAFLVGGVKGTGKTLLACCTATELYRWHGVSASYWTVPNLLQALRDTYSQEKREDGSSAFTALLNFLKKSELVVLDDLGVENPTAWAMEQLFTIFDTRYSHRRSTIVTSNESHSTLIAQLGRITSRLSDTALSEVIRFEGPDRRLDDRVGPPWWANESAG